MSFIDGIIKTIGGAVDGVLDKFLRDKMSEGEAAIIKLEAQRLIAADLRQQEETFRKFVVEYEGAAKDLPKSIQILRGTVRPVLTYGLASAFVVAFFQDANYESLRLLWQLNLLSLGFWFGEKLISRTGLNEFFTKRTYNGKENGHQGS